MNPEPPTHLIRFFCTTCSHEHKELPDRCGFCGRSRLADRTAFVSRTFADVTLPTPHGLQTRDGGCW